MNHSPVVVIVFRWADGRDQERPWAFVPRVGDFVNLRVPGDPVEDWWFGTVQSITWDEASDRVIARME